MSIDEKAIREQLDNMSLDVMKLQNKTLAIQQEMLALREEVIYLRGFQKGVLAVREEKLRYHADGKEENK